MKKSFLVKGYSNFRIRRDEIVKCDSLDESYYNHYFFVVLFIMI